MSQTCVFTKHKQLIRSAWTMHRYTTLFVTHCILRRRLWWPRGCCVWLGLRAMLLVPWTVNRPSLDVTLLVGVKRTPMSAINLANSWSRSLPCTPLPLHIWDIMIFEQWHQLKVLLAVQSTLQVAVLQSDNVTHMFTTTHCRRLKCNIMPAYSALIKFEHVAGVF